MIKHKGKRNSTFERDYKQASIKYKIAHGEFPNPAPEVKKEESFVEIEIRKIVEKHIFPKIKSKTKAGRKYEESMTLLLAHSLGLEQEVDSWVKDINVVIKSALSQQIDEIRKGFVELGIEGAKDKDELKGLYLYARTLNMLDKLLKNMEGKLEVNKG